MSAELLRQAADKLDEVVVAATPGPWHSLGQWLARDVHQCTCFAGSLPEGHKGGCGFKQIGTLHAPDAKFCAAMSPPVAKALAELLRRDAGFHDAVTDAGGGGLADDHPLIAVARAIFGDP